VKKPTLSVNKKHIGRPPVGSTLIGVRLPPIDLAALDTWLPSAECDLAHILDPPEWLTLANRIDLVISQTGERKMTRPRKEKREMHARSVSLLSLAAALLFGWPAAGQDRGNGTIIKDEPCTLRPFTYAQETGQFKAFYEREAAAGRQHGLIALPYRETYEPSEAEWDAMRAHKGFA